MSFCGGRVSEIRAQGIASPSAVHTLAEVKIRMQRLLDMLRSRCLTISDTLPKREHPLRAACIAAGLLLLLSVFGCAAVQHRTAEAAEQTPILQEDILRLHVIANSDSAADQAVKLSVRDAVLAAVEAQPSAEQTRDYLLTHGSEILSAAETTLRENGFSYGAQLMLGSYEFPDRTYGDAFFPAGEYEALRIVLGAGAGQNWWCVLFPPLCIVTEEAEPLQEGEKIEFHSSIWDWIQSRRENRNR